MLTGFRKDYDCSIEEYEKTQEILGSDGISGGRYDEQYKTICWYLYNSSLVIETQSTILPGERSHKFTIISKTQKKLKETCQKLRLSLEERTST